MKTNIGLNQKLDLVAKHLGVSNLQLLGKGNEGSVYEYKDKALKIFLKNPDLKFLQDTRKFLYTLEKKGFSFKIPRILEIGEVSDVVYTIEDKLDGVQMDKKIIDLKTKDRQKVYRGYYDAIKEFNSVSLSNLPFGHILKRKDSVTSTSWVDFLISVVKQKANKASMSLRELVTDFDKKMELFDLFAEKYLDCNKKQLVYGDYYLNNVLISEDLKVSAILDINAHAMVGDPRVDISSVLRWNEIDPNVKKEDYEFLTKLAKKDFGEDIEDISDLYLLFSSFYFSDMEDPSFSVKHLNNQKIWRKFRR